MWVQSLGQEDPLEEGMATHSSILAGRISWTEEPDRLQSMGSQRVGHDWSNWAQQGAHTCIVSCHLQTVRVSSFRIWIPFLFLLCCCGYDFQNCWVIVVSVGTLVLFLILGEMLSVFRLMFAVGLSYMAFIMLRLVPSMLIFWRVFFFNHKWVLNFVKNVLCNIDVVMWFLSFNLLLWCITLKNPCIPEINPSWSGCMSLLMWCWILFARTLLMIFASGSSVICFVF